LFSTTLTLKATLSSFPQLQKMLREVGEHWRRAVQ
jgi:hypothetical protein